MSTSTASFPLGPGDVINLSVPEVEELQKQELRVSPDGTISLPLIGTMEVAGMGENDLRNAMSRRLAVYMKVPRVELFVERYQARDVAVIGAVQKPGLYDLRNSNQSILDMIGLAGGMTTEAAQKVIFLPRNYDQARADASQAGLSTDAGMASQVRPANDVAAANFDQQNASDSQEISHSSRSQPVPETVSKLPSEVDAESHRWIVLDSSEPGSRACLDFPTRPGDVVIVPIAGQVMVQGWVKSPGAFKITPGMTILGSVSAAGGAMFSWSAKLLRTDAEGRQTTTEFDLGALAKGEGSDIAVQSGDVVVVERSAIGAVPYTVFELFQRFGTGIGFPVP
jgi:polysaccharide export outer membrane protein